MAMPELDIGRVQRWCAARVPEHARHQVRVERWAAARHITIVERRAPWHNDKRDWTSFPIARGRHPTMTSPSLAGLQRRRSGASEGRHHF
jgi:hypothetical protein